MENTTNEMKRLNMADVMDTMNKAHELAVELFKSVGPKDPATRFCMLFVCAEQDIAHDLRDTRGPEHRQTACETIGRRTGPNATVAVTLVRAQVNGVDGLIVAGMDRAGNQLMNVWKVRGRKLRPFITDEENFVSPMLTSFWAGVVDSV